MSRERDGPARPPEGCLDRRDETGEAELLAVPARRPTGGEDELNEGNVDPLDLRAIKGNDVRARKGGGQIRVQRLDRSEGAVGGEPEDSWTGHDGP